jgi:hypothetical protein
MSAMSSSLAFNPDNAARRLNRARRAYTFRRVFHTHFPHPSRSLRTSSAVGRVTIRSALFWIAAACCVVAELAILRSLLFGNARDAERQIAASGPGAVSRSPRPVEIAWALLPAIGLIFVLYLTWRALDARLIPLGSESNRSIRVQLGPDGLTDARVAPVRSLT